MLRLLRRQPSFPPSPSGLKTTAPFRPSLGQTGRLITLPCIRSLEEKNIHCSSPVTEDVPLRGEQSIHGVPPCVTGLIVSRRVPLHPTSVYGLVHSRSVDSINAHSRPFNPRDFDFSLCLLLWWSFRCSGSSLQ